MPVTFRATRREELGPVSFATSDIQDVFSVCQVPRDRVSVEVLELELAFDFGDITLAGPRESFGVQLRVIHANLSQYSTIP